MNADALLGEPSHHAEETLQLGIREHGRGLVEHDEARIARERLGDLDHLPSGDAERADRGRGSRSSPRRSATTAVVSASRGQSTIPQARSSAGGP